MAKALVAFEAAAQRIVNFLRDKVKNLSIRDLVHTQVEALGFWIVGGLPGILGFALRALIYKALFKGLHGFCWVQPGVTIIHSNHLTVGRHFGCNTGAYINAIGGITMGDYVLIGSNVTISSGVHPIDGASPPVFARATIPKPILIEDDVWIAAGAVILPGTVLRKGTVVGANAVVTKDTEEYSINVGAPARKVGSRIAS